MSKRGLSSQFNMVPVNMMRANENERPVKYEHA